jgi:hypothetical protein
MVRTRSKIEKGNRTHGLLWYGSQWGPVVPLGWKPSRGQFHFRRAVFSQELKGKVDLVLDKTTSSRINQVP